MSEEHLVSDYKPYLITWLKKAWHSIDQPRKDERLNQRSLPMVLNSKPLDWESSALTTRPLPHFFISLLPKIRLDKPSSEPLSLSSDDKEISF